MKEITFNDRVVGKYYLEYVNGDEVKRFDIYKWEGIFTSTHSHHSVMYRIGKPYKYVTTFSGIVISGRDELLFELTDEEEFKHITMELITQNL